MVFLCLSVVEKKQGRHSGEANRNGVGGQGIKKRTYIIYLYLYLYIIFIYLYIYTYRNGIDAGTEIKANFTITHPVQYPTIQLIFIFFFGIRGIYYDFKDSNLHHGYWALLYTAETGSTCDSSILD